MATFTFQKPDKVIMIDSTDFEGKFEFRPLEPGYGLTVGNALRRVLLSSLEGFAITSIKIENVEHEFTSLPGIVEDVTEIILNLKQMIGMRVSCTMAAQKNYVGAFHVDLKEHPYLHQMKTAILYLNSNNGGTQIKDGEFIQSKVNRAVVFPCHQEHAGVWCTDKKLRFVLNMNYIEN